MTDKLILSDEEWQRRLSREQYEVLRRHGTERAGTGCFLGTKEPGTYVCAGCGNPLFQSGEKYESGTGWPSFTRPISADAIVTRGARHAVIEVARRARRRGAKEPVRGSLVAPPPPCR